MAYDNKKWKLTEDDFGPLLPYINDDSVTDITLNCNGAELWVTYVDKGKQYIENHECTPKFVETFTTRVCNNQSKQFNKQEPVLEADTDKLRISCLFGSVAKTGTSICIRKSLPVIRITAKEALEQKYFTKPILNLLVNCVKAKMNVVFCGEPGVGKTECAKFFSQFIKPEDRVITIEDNLEFHYKEINPGKDCVELQIDDNVFEYDKALKAVLRQNPDWVFLSEARSHEVKHLLTCWSSGICGFTTLHTDDVRKIPDRIENMMGSQRDADRLENDIYSFVNVGVLVRKKKRSDGTVYRYIDQVCFFVREGNKNRIVMVVEDGKMLTKTITEGEGKNKTERNVFVPLPADILKKMVFADIEKPLECSDFDNL